MEIVLLANDNYFSDGQHLRREADHGRQYIGQDADIHEDATDLQMAVNNYYSTLPRSNRLEKLNIFDSRNGRLAVSNLHAMIFRIIAPYIELPR